MWCIAAHHLGVMSSRVCAATGQKVHVLRLIWVNNSVNASRSSWEWGFDYFAYNNAKDVR